MLVNLHNIFVNNKINTKDEEPHQIIARQIRAIMAELDNIESKSSSASSIKQKAIDSDDRRIISPGNLGAVTGENK